MTDVLRFKDEDAAWQYLIVSYEYDHHVDFGRLAYLDDQAAVETYYQKQQEGHYGSIHITCEIAGRSAMLGFNFGE